LALIVIIIKNELLGKTRGALVKTLK